MSNAHLRVYQDECVHIFCNVAPNKERLKLVSRPNKIKEFINVVDEKNIVGQIKPFHAGEILQWQVEGIVN